MKNAALLSIIFLKSIIGSAQTKKILIPYRQVNRWGFCDTLAKIIIQPKYDSTAFLQTYGVINTEAGKIFSAKKQGVLSFEGKVIVPPQFDEVSEFEGGYKVRVKNKEGFYSAAGKFLLPANYDAIEMATYNSSNYFKLKIGEKYGLYILSKNKQIPVVYDLITTEFYSDKIPEGKYFFAKKRNEKFLIDKQTGDISAYKGAEEPTTEDGILAPMEIQEAPDMKKEQMEKTKQQFQVDDVLPYNNLTAQFTTGVDVYKVKKNGKTGLAFYSPANTITLLPPVYDSIGYGLHLSYATHYLQKKSAYLFAVKKEDHFGLINEVGEEILPFQYDMIKALPGSIISFELTTNNKKGVFMPYTFYPVIEPKYDAIEHFTNLPVSDSWSFALLKVRVNGKTGFVGENGKEFFKN